MHACRHPENRKDLVTTRVIVVGSGVVGGAAAWHLARSGASVTVVDADMAGRATAAGAGIIAPGASYHGPDAFYPLTFAAAAAYPQILAALAEDGQGTDWYGEVGALVVAMEASGVERLDLVARLCEERRSHGVSHIGPVERVDAAQARRLFPLLGDVAGAVRLGAAARLDGRLLREALLDAAVHHGATMRTGTAEPCLKGGRITGIGLDGERLEADAVLLAGGAWSAAFGAQAGVAVPVYPQRGQILHVRAAGSGSEHWPVVMGASSHYIVAFPGQRVVAGATREDGAGLDAAATAGGVAEVLAQFLRVAPGAASAAILEVRVGLRPATADHLPILGPAPGVDGLYLATGHGANGLTAGPYSGVQVARQILGQVPAVDLAPYGMARFG